MSEPTLESLQYTINTAYMLVASAGVFVITPGIGLFYAGMLRKNSAMQVIVQSYITTFVVTIQWWIWGYALALGDGSSFLGNLNMAFLKDSNPGPLVEGGPVPSAAYFIFSVFFPVCTVQIFLGSTAERGRVIPAQIIGFLFTTVVYCPLAYWFWAPKGWLLVLGTLDFAGGAPVHIAGGTASLAYAMFLGPRKITPRFHAYKPHNATMSMIGTTLIWYGWLFFNSGTLQAVNTRTAYIMLNTHLSASAAGMTYVIYDKIFHKKFSMMGACEGAIAGLVAVTPSCGYVAPWAAFTGGIMTALVCRLTINVNKWLRVDDAIYSFNLHAIGGCMGSLVTGFFASSTWTDMDGSKDAIAGGWIANHWVQIPYQLAGLGATIGWTFVVTYILCFVVDKIPGLKLRVDEDQELKGMDAYDILESAGETIDGVIVNTTEILVAHTPAHTPDSGSFVRGEKKE
ncbi:ammonium transporter AmtB-like domain-containing protein [Yarrowia lipolytica]|uniref:Ammonium transporter n=1 Tax=Yarrowia lipolytica (strain CLIB 122 / E 150) TaxID=284591 RepID=Q6CGH6_YARLI|nr:YALI0A19228p [Yarrowia lipolytica CLIB122]RDW31849.1 ammonium transporter AmtB-like domain-containing protein [Yarrowia lipolytica]RDW39940.1 ammonium transporter AmtB-like domain-containing protein [Yarrowia lipolytica]CAG84169.1 YALI0A19228p [Yarrowia lipolytica CLIB122]|eukprot:XP_500236.1 YALI0A19228p [Yarrowia lipolytica CLIB122]